MKPKLGRKIYYIYKNEIYADNVGYVGKESFIIDSFCDAIVFDALEWYYDDYNIEWFTSIEKAKKELRKRYDKKIKIVKVDDSWYRIED